MLAKFLHPLHPTWLFYAAIWGILIGLIFGVTLRQIIFTSPGFLILAVLAILLCLKFSSIFTISIAFVAGFMIGNFRISSDLVNQNLLTAYQDQTITITGQLSEDLDTSKGTTTLRLTHLQLHISNGPVENKSNPVENSAKTVQKPVDNSVENSHTELQNNPQPNNRNTEPQNTPQPNHSDASPGANLSIPGTLYVTLASKSELERSDRITIEGKLDAGFGNFVGKISRAKILSLERSSPGDIFAKFKHWFSDLVREFIPSPEVDLGLGYLMGMKSGLSEDFAEALQLVGMTHVVVASGAHLGILTAAARKIFGKISKFASLLFSLLLIAAFVCIVGFTPSMTRAALVASLSLLAGYVGRKFTPLRLISFVAMLTLLINPSHFLSLGWQLSFASFFAILILAPRLTKTFYGGKAPPWLASMLLTSLATSLVCAPILIYNFGTLSLLSFVANLFILPTLPYAMLGMLLTGVSSFFTPLAAIIAKLTTLLLDLHITLINFLSDKTMFILEFPSANPCIYLLYLPLLLYLISPPFLKLRQSRRAPALVPIPADSKPPDNLS